MERRTLLGSSVVAGMSLIGGCFSAEDDGDSSPNPNLDPGQETTIKSTDSEVSGPDPDLQHLHGLSGQTYPPDVEGAHNRRFEWSAVGGEWWYELNIARSIGAYYAARYGRSRNYDMYVYDSYGNHYIRAMADEFKRMGNVNNLTDRQIVELVVAFVQQLKYTKDDVRAGFDQHTSFPVETLINRGGDCEDSVILLAGLLEELGYGCLLLAFWEADPAHMALGVKGDASVRGTYYEHKGESYYYIETTSGWSVGELPDWLGNTRAEYIETGHYPTFVYEYNTSPSQEGGIELTFTVENFGQVISMNPVFSAEFEDLDGAVWGRQTSELGITSKNESKTDSMILMPPNDRTLRITTSIFDDHSLYDTDTTEWREPA